MTTSQPMSPVTREDLRGLFLFESLTDEHLDWLAGHGSCRTYDTGVVVFREGDPGTELFVLLSGALRLSRMASGEDVVLTETDQRGVYAGAVRAYLEDEAPYGTSVVATSPSTFYVLPARDFSSFMRTWFPMSVHLLEGLYLGIRNSEATVRQREHLARLGTLSANLAHELNNPAAATVRATGQLRDRIGAQRHKLGMIAEGRLDPETIARLVVHQDAAVELAAKNRRLHRTPVQEADLEDALVDRLDELGIAGAYDLAPVFVGSGLDVDWLSGVVDDVPRGALEGALRWLAYTLETESLMDEVEDASARISTLVAAVKQYSAMDTASLQEIDVHVGLDSTLVMLGHKLQGVEVVKEYDRSLPRLPAYSAELNQVWTNLLDNAADAMGGRGRLVVRTSRDGDHAVVEIADDGPGIPEDVQPRVFEAFYTTKPPGSGSGLGLENALRIVARRHHGQLTFTTGRAGTTFSVRLPFVQVLV